MKKLAVILFLFATPIFAQQAWNEAMNQAMVSYDEDNFPQAIEDAEKALDISIKKNAEDHPNTAAAYNLIGLSLMALEKWQEAEYNLLRAENILNKSVDIKRFEITILYDNLAVCYTKQSKHSKAEEYFLKSLDIKKQLFDENDLRLSDSYNSLGLLYFDMSLYDKALENFNKAVDIRRKFHNDNHPSLIQPLNHIMKIHEVLGNKKNYENSILKVYKLEKNQKDKNYKGMEYLLGKLMYIYKNNKDTTGQEYVLQEQIELYSVLLGENDPIVAVACNNLAELYRSTKDFDNAEKYYNQALNIYKQDTTKLSEEASVLNNLATMLMFRKEYDKAKEIYLKVINIKKAEARLNAPKAEELALVYNNLATLFVYQKKYKDALNYFNLSLKIMENLSEKNEQTLINLYKNMAYLYNLTGDKENAKILTDKAKTLENK